MSIELIKELRLRTGAGIMDCKKALEESNNDVEAAVDWLRKNGIAKAAKKADRIAAEGSVFLSTEGTKVVMAEVNSETDFVASNEKFTTLGQKIADALLASDIAYGMHEASEAGDVTIDGETIEASLTNLTAIIGEKISFRRFFISDPEEATAVGVYKHSNNKIGTVVFGKDMDEAILRDVAMHAAAMKPEFLSMDEVPAEDIAKETEIAKEEMAENLEGKPEEIKEKMIQGKVNKQFTEVTLLEQAFVKDSSKKIKDLQGSGKILSFTTIIVGEGMQKREENFAEEVAKQMNQ